MHRRAFVAGACSAAIASNTPRAESRIPVDRYGPTTGSKPAIVLLHGSDGLTNGGRYEFAAQAIAAAGYAVFLPRYFEATGDRRARYGEIQAKFPVWRQAIASALGGEIERAIGVAPGRIGVVGFSLGAALALALAAKTPRINAVVDFFGFAPPGLEGARRLPPTLILHGDADRVVPVSNAVSIERTLKSRGGVVESHIYPGEGHGLSFAALPDAVGRTLEFLRRYL
ncbi:dienelactone hydrolase family protein [Bosea sp. 2RAB26]|uniref:dienelactone hydrolase family protein n=1 Tax=Bosea sp. 2RAB26 TaxID=3237476 RepID=UPI003F9246F0